MTSPQSLRVAVFSCRPYDRRFLEQANHGARHRLDYFDHRLDADTASLAADYDAVCAFVNDQLDGEVLRTLHAQGVRLAVLRCAGFNNVDLDCAQEIGITVARVPAYSPHAVAEHAMALILALNRRITRASARVREGNFALDGLLGFDLHGRIAAVIGTGRIGEVMVRILNGFGCRVIAHDPVRNPECRVTYMSIEDCLADADIISLHLPLTPRTVHLIDDAAVARMRRGVMLINTSRGALIDTTAVIRGLKSGHIGHLGLDVYEEEEGLFFDDHSDEPLQDDVFSRLLTFPNVLITGHQAFFTADALGNIARTTISNLDDFAANGDCVNAVTA